VRRQYPWFSGMVIPFLSFPGPPETENRKRIEQ
jgi:hypothetical protein